jgi:hypothetical protein
MFFPMDKARAMLDDILAHTRPGGVAPSTCSSKAPPSWACSNPSTTICSTIAN